MIVRIFAILLAVGMLVISTQATDLATPDTAALVDADELPPAALVEPLTVIPDRPATQISPPPRIESTGRRPETELFRPPRVAAFV